MSKVIFFHNHEGQEMICVEFMDSDEVIVHLFKCQPKVASTPNRDALRVCFCFISCCFGGRLGSTHQCETVQLMFI